MRCTKENRIDVIKTGTDETVSDVSKSLQVIVTRLVDLVRGLVNLRTGQLVDHALENSRTGQLNSLIGQLVDNQLVDNWIAYRSIRRLVTGTWNKLTWVRKVAIYITTLHQLLVVHLFLLLIKIILNLSRIRSWLEPDASWRMRQAGVCQITHGSSTVKETNVSLERSGCIISHIGNAKGHHDLGKKSCYLYHYVT